MIRVRGLEKSYGRLPVLRGLDADVPTGRVTALVGPNAAGKTTLVKSILGLVRPGGGTIELDGRRIGPDPAVRERIGYMPQLPAFPDNLRVRELFRFVDELRGMETTRPADAAPGGRPRQELIELFGLTDSLDRRLGTLSGGTRQKVNAALAFRYGTEVLILDEPTAGLDPLSRSRLKDLIRDERERGVTILVTSHVLSELRELAEHLVYLVDGRTRHDGPVDALLRRMETDDLERAVARLMEADAGERSADARPSAGDRPALEVL
ncbi:MAG: ABC transporter ATP-binding protein [Gemmatimonadota bacterium]